MQTANNSSMAEIGTHHKKRRIYQIKNLHLGAKVEVRSEEDGFQGSWHPGVVIACANGSREVKYDNFLADNERDPLIEIVKIPSAYNIYGRGRIRPLPSSSEVTEEELHYGLCVDCYYNEAWWEGVVYDHENGSSERSIFFPDLGFERMSNIKQLRLTHDWDRVKGEWKLRGRWYFLQIMEEYKKVNRFVPVSQEQIWYDMIAKDEFVEIGEWPFPVQAAWKKLIEQVIDDNLRPTLGVVQEDEDLARQHEDATTMVSEMCESTELALADFPDNQMVSVQPNALSVMCPDQKGFDSSTRPEVECKLSRRNCGTDNNDWNMKPEFCPESINKYMLAEKPDLDLTNSVRRHLLSLGYKMEYHVKLRRMCYMSPRKRTFYHLRKCVIFEKEQLEKESLAAEDVQIAMSSLPDNMNCNSQPLEVSNTRAACSTKKKRKMLENHSSDEEDDEGEMNPSLHNLNFCPQQRKVHQTKRKNLTYFDVEPKYFPKVIFQYVRISSKKCFVNNHELVNGARGHLAATGWKFWFKMRNGREEWRYVSPFTKKTYYSLNSACKAIESGQEMLGEDPKGLSGGELSISGEDVHGFSVSKSGSRKSLQALRKFKAGKLHKRKPDGYAHSMLSLLDEQEKDGDDGVAKQQSIRLSTSSLSKEKRALDKVRNNSRVLRSSKRAQTKPSSSSQLPRTVLSWLIDNDAVLAREKVQYFRNGDDKPVAEGRITNCGINCSCCAKIYTLSGFEDHAGCNSLRPAANLFFCRDDKSLLQRQLDMMHQRVRNFSKEPLKRTCGKRLKSGNDLICSICHCGGALILCDRCPASFHANCLDLQDIPEGDWFCPSCCCGICKESDFDDADKNILYCHQCERQYHAHCARNRNMVELDTHPTEYWFCCKMCEKVQWGLQQLLGKPILVGRNNLTWTLVKPMDYLATEHDECDVVAMAENFSKLNVALEVLHECFEPVKELQTRRDVVEDVIFCRGSNLNRLNFKGFYTVLLERDDELITVAILRVYGDNVAEIPLIATRFKYRRLGMCRIVMEEIEKNLVNLGVKKLVLPAATSVLNTWTSAFGFTPFTNSERSEFLGYAFLDFQDTVMCHKTLRNVPSPLLQLSKDAAGGIHHRVHQNLKGKNINPEPEGSSAISEVSQEDPREGSETVDQGVLVNDTEEKSNCSDNGKDAPIAMESDPTKSIVSLELKEQKIEGDRTVRQLIVYKRRKKAELRPSISQQTALK